MHHHVQGAIKIGDLAKNYQIYSFKYRVHLLHGYYKQTLTFENRFINEKNIAQVLKYESTCNLSLNSNKFFLQL